MKEAGDAHVVACSFPFCSLPAPLNNELKVSRKKGIVRRIFAHASACVFIVCSEPNEWSKV